MTPLEQALWALFEHTTASVEITDAEGRMVRSAGDAILVNDLESAFFVDANPAACELWGYTLQELRRRSGRMLAAPEERTTVDAMSASLVSTGHAFAPQLQMLRKDGSRFWGSLRLTSYQVQGRGFYVAIVRDVSDEVRREHALAEQSRRLEQANERLLHSERLAALGQLSAAVAPVDNGLAPRPRAEPSAASARRRARILIIDDDALVLRGLQRMLSSDHEVVLANGGQEGLEILAADRRFDVILCDLMMPTTDGLEVHATLAERAPELLPRLVFCSGGAFTPRARAFLGSVDNEVLGKPMRRDELLGVIAKRLG